MRLHRNRPIARQERGIALIAVIAALSALLLIAVPFSLSMRDHQQSATSFAARTKARMGAEAALAHVKSRLHRTHVSIDETPDFDTRDEFTADLSEIPFESGDPRGLMLAATVEDEQGKINLNTASPFLLGNLLGVARVSIPVAPEDTTIPIDDVSGFSEDGGFAWIGGELVRYSSLGQDGLQGCERGAQVPWARFLNPLEHEEGEVVLDASAVFLSYLGVWLGREQNRVAPLTTLTDAKRVSELGEVSITSGDVDRLLDVCTLHSLAPGGEGFGNAQEVLAPLLMFEEDEYGGRRAQLRNARYMNSGTSIEISDGERRFYTMVNRAPRMPNVDPNQIMERIDLTIIGGSSSQAGVGQITTSSGSLISTDGIEQLLAATVAPPAMRSIWLPLSDLRDLDPGDNRTFWVKSRPRHPVNINTADERVLELLLTNLQLSGNQDYVSRDEARAILDLIREQPVTSHEDLLQRILSNAVDNGAISEADLAAIYLNAMNANDARLAFSTAPFCYRSYDVFSVETTAIVNNAAGMELDRHSIREVVHVSPQEVLSWKVDTQEEFENQILAGRSGKYLVSYPQNVARYERDNRPPDRYPQNRFLEIFPSKRGENDEGDDEGDVRARPTRNYRNTNVEHFDTENSYDGYSLEEGVYEAPFIRALESDLGMTAGFVRFWFQLPDGGSDVTLFDAGESEQQNRIRCFYDPGDGALKLQVFDATFDDATNPGPDAAECSFPMTIEPETWYHVTAAWRGTKPGDLTLIVDGINRTEHAYRTRLAQDLSMGTNPSSISVENAESFPPSGAILLGDEVFEYDGRTNSSFSLVPDLGGTNTRGRRGTQARDHVAGTSVELFGYVNAIESDIPVGGATLAGDLGEFAAAMIMNPPTGSIPNPNGRPFPALTGNVTSLSIGPLPDAGGGNAYSDAFQQEGYAIIVSGSNNANEPGPRTEVIAYRKSGTSVLEVQRGSFTPFMQLVANQGGGGGGGAAGTGIAHPLGQFIAVVIPISIQARGGNLAENYLDPFDNENAAGSERIQLGRPTVTGAGAALDFEWVRYDSIDTNGGFFIRDDATAWTRARNVVTEYNSGGTGTTSGTLTERIQNQLSFRGGFGAISHNGGTEVIPCFRTWGAGPGQGDAITVVASGGGRTEQAVVSWATLGRGFAKDNQGNRTGGTTDFYYVSLDRALSGAFQSDIEQLLLDNNSAQARLTPSRQLTRILKFPSGELPTRVPPTLGFGASMSGGASAGMILDEVEINRMRSNVYVINYADNDATTTPGDTDIPLMRQDGRLGHGVGPTRRPRFPTSGFNSGFPHVYNPNQAPNGRSGIHPLGGNPPPFTEFPPDGGLVWVGDEIVAYREVEDRGPNSIPGGEYLLRDCIRGVFGTEPGTHRDGERVHLLSFMNVSRLSSGLSPTANVIQVDDARGFPPVGVLGVIGSGFELDELIGYTQANDTSFWMPSRRSETGSGPGEGIFRGRYGTAPVAAAGRDLVVEMPFRFWDRYVPESDDPELSYVELSRRIPGAYFLSFDWAEQLPRAHNDIEVLVRIDERARWDDEPLGKENGLFRFEDPLDDDVANELGMSGELIEVRIFLRYKNGAFNALGTAHAWKDTAWIQAIQVDYLTPRTVASREVIP